MRAGGEAADIYSSGASPAHWRGLSVLADGVASKVRRLGPPIRLYRQAPSTGRWQHCPCSQFFLVNGDSLKTAACISHLSTLILLPTIHCPSALLSRRALGGEYVLPEAGGDLLRDGAGVLPTGRNIHALDPYRMPRCEQWGGGE